MMAYFIFAGLVFVAFLIMLSGFLRGAKKTQIDAEPQSVHDLPHQGNCTPAIRLEPATTYRGFVYVSVITRSGVCGKQIRFLVQT
jgi:hypothetical protein